MNSQVKQLQEENRLLFDQLTGVQEELARRQNEPSQADVHQLLFDQLTVVQEELERLQLARVASAAPPSVIRLQWTGDYLPELQAELLRCQALLAAQRTVHRLEQEQSLASRLGQTLILGAASPAAMLGVPGKLHKVWRQTRKKRAPKSLGGAGYAKAIAAYREGGFEIVEALLKEAAVVAELQADAWTAVARDLMQDDTHAAAEAARRAYTLDPQIYRLKWLAFRLHEAGSLLEAEALLMLLPADTKFSASETKQAALLKAEAGQFRLSQARQDTRYTEGRAEIERRFQSLVDARKEQADLASLQAEALREAQLKHAKSAELSHSEISKLRSEYEMLATRLDRQERACIGLAAQLDEEKAFSVRLRNENIALQQELAALAQSREEQATQLAPDEQSRQQLEVLQEEVSTLQVLLDEVNAISMQRYEQLVELQTQNPLSKSKLRS